MEESLREEWSETIVNAIMCVRLDASFRSQYEVGMWLKSIKLIFDKTLTNEQYRELWDFGLDHIKDGE